MSTKTRTLKVRCEFFIDIEVPDDDEFNDVFMIEENSCPGTGIVGMTLMEHIDKHQKASTCWACALGGENHIVGIGIE